MGVNHDPNSTVSLHKDDGSPVQTSLSLTFKEIELQVSEDEGIDMSGKIEEAAQQADNAARAQAEMGSEDGMGALF